MKITLRQYRDLLDRYLRPQRRRVAVLALAVLANIGLSLANPQLLKAFIDQALGGGAMAGLLGLGGLFLAIAVANQLLAVAEAYLAENIGLIATNQMRAELTAHCLSLDPSFHTAHTPGELIERVDGDVATLGSFFSRFAVQLFANGLLLAGVLVMLARVDWRVGGALGLFALAAFAVLVRLRNVAGPRWQASREAQAGLFGFLEERLAGAEDIRSCGAIPYVMRRLAEHSRRVLRRELAATAAGSSTWAVTIALFAAGTAVALAIGGLLYGAGEISLGTVFLVYAYAEMLGRPIEAISRQVENLQQANAGIVRIQQLLSTRSAVVEKAPPAIQPLRRGPGGPEVQFDGVSFGYESGEPVVKDLSFRVAPGQRFGLLGRSGSGKTTLTRLLFRLYDPIQGAVRLDGIDLRDVALADLRRRVGIVTQDIQLFHATVRDNLTFFDRSIPDSRIQPVLEDVGLGDWLDRLPGGLDAVLAPGGGGLSAGEAQLLAFVRVFLKDPGLVILDEASSRLDPVTERRLDRAVERLLFGRTGIVIAHRLATVQRVDHILILEDGRLRETGPREQLARDPDSHFAHLMRTGLEEALA